MVVLFSFGVNSPRLPTFTIISALTLQHIVFPAYHPTTYCICQAFQNIVSELAFVFIHFSTMAQSKIQKILIDTIYAVGSLAEVFNLLKHQSHPIHFLLRMVMPAIPFPILKLFLDLPQPFLCGLIHPALIHSR